MKTKTEEIREDLISVKDLVVLSESKGGQQLIKSLSEDIFNSIDRITSERMTLDLQGYISLACDIKTKLDILKVLKKAKNNEEYLKQLLDEALSE